MVEWKIWNHLQIGSAYFTLIFQVSQFWKSCRSCLLYFLRIFLSFAMMKMTHFHFLKHLLMQCCVKSVSFSIVNLLFVSFQTEEIKTDNKEPINYKSNKRLYQISISQTLLFQTRNILIGQVSILNILF
jgi:hypothetical protein